MDTKADVLPIVPGFTPGPWYATNHFANPDTPCNCAYVLSEGYAGSICQISIDNGKNIADGGNDSPPLEEAAANGRLIAAVPELYGAAHAFLEAWTAVDNEDAEARAAIALGQALAKAAQSGEVR